MRKPSESIKIFSERRARLSQQLEGSVLICASGPEAVRNGTVGYPFRQDSNLYYLTGWEEPESILVMRPGKSPATVLFVREKDESRETWDGFRFGPEGAVEFFGVDAAYPVSEFNKRIVDLMRGSDRLYYRFFKNPEVDEMVNSAIQRLKTSMGRSGVGLLPVYDADQLLGEARVIKGPMELENHRQACRISAEAHTEVMKFVRSGRNEREIHGFFLYQIMKRGAAREGYNSIVASGPSACTLHYVFNDQPLKDRDLLLIDAGGEYNYFTADITRTYPVNGKFTDEQAEVYQGVLDIQKHIVQMVRPGVSMVDLQAKTTEMLTDLMLELGLFSGRRDDLIQAGQQVKYYPHRVSHYLGMDVHDLGLYVDKSNQPRPLEEGMVLTIEPGLYIPAHDSSAPHGYAGIGVRIEDDILVTANGFENMTALCPKEIGDLQKIIGQGAALS